MKDFLGGYTVAGGKLKEAGTSHWLSPNTGATNLSGFTALPAGYRNPEGNYAAFIKEAYFWTTTPYNTTRSMCMALKHDSENYFFGNNPNEDGLVQEKTIVK